MPTVSPAPLAVIPLQVARRTEPGQAGALGQLGRRMPLPWEGVGREGNQRCWETIKVVQPLSWLSV